MPNFLATFALVGYPFFIVLLFLMYRPPLATALSLLLAEMLLPPGYTLPLSSPTWLNKDSIPVLATFCAAMVFGRSYMRRSRPLRGVEWLYVVMFVGAFLTMFTNMDPVGRGPVTLQGEHFGDFTSDAIRSVVVSWMVFFLGRVMFKSSRELVSLCRVIALGALYYSIPALYEIRMSPQIQRTIYGYGPESFGQAMRWGGYRPNVLFTHGLELSMFFFGCLIILVALARAKKRLGPVPMRGLCIYFAIVLVLCKSTGVIFYEALALPVIALGQTRAWFKLALVVVTIFVVYPLLRFADAIPTKQIGDAFVSLSPDRAQSLTYRFDMEQGMLDLTRLRPWFGWGGYNRNFLFDLHTGRKTTVPDGWVILVLSTRGLVGFLGYFGPMVAAVVRGARLGKKIKDRSHRFLVAGLTLTGAFFLFDLIVNSSLPPIFMLLFGALYALPPAVLAEEEAAAQAEAAAYAGYDPYGAVPAT